MLSFFRVGVLREYKEQQLSDLKSFAQNRNKLTDAAQSLAERYDDFNEKQQELLRRLHLAST